MSIHAFAYLADRYALLASGCASAIVTARAHHAMPSTLDDLRGKTIAIPGKLTTAYLALQLCLGKRFFDCGDAL